MDGMDSADWGEMAEKVRGKAQEEGGQKQCKDKVSAK